MPEVPTWIVVAFFAGVVIWALFHLSMLPLRRRTLAQLRGMSTEELEKQVFMYPSGYFAYIGEGDPAVIRFREIVEARDLSALSREWRSLERTFRGLEHKAGHSGRPLIMDYFFWYDL